MDITSSSVDIATCRPPDELSDLISCMDTACCGGEVAAANGGRVPKSGLGAAAADLVASINGTELDTAQWAGPGRG